MNSNFVCPVCKKNSCFVCKYWNDDQLVDQLLAENGALCYEHFDSIWFELLTHYFVCYGKVETTIGELYSTFQRNGFLPFGLKSVLKGLENEKKITIKYKTENKSWFSSLFRRFKRESIDENTIIRCDYIVKEASSIISEVASNCGVTLFVLSCKDSVLRYIKSNMPSFEEIDPQFYKIAEASRMVINSEECRPLDLKAQSRQFLRNLRDGDDMQFAQICCDEGIGSIYSVLDISIFSLNPSSDMELHLSIIPLKYKLHRKEVDYAMLEDNFNKNNRQLVQEYKHKKRSDLKERYKSLKIDYENKRKRISNEITFLRKQLDTIQDAVTAKSMYNMQLNSAALLKQWDISVDEVEDVMDGIQTQREEIKEMSDRITNPDETELDTDLEKKLDAMIIQDSLPNPPTTIHSDRKMVESDWNVCSTN